MNTTDIEQCAHKLVAEKLHSGEQVNVTLSVQELINQQGEIMGDGVPFFLWCARDAVTRVMKKVVERYNKPRPDDQSELSLQTKEGYPFLRIAYPIMRDGEHLIILVEQLTDEELEARAVEFEKQADSLVAHAGDIRRYIVRRKAAKNREAKAQRETKPKS